MLVTYLACLAQAASVYAQITPRQTADPVSAVLSELESAIPSSVLAELGNAFAPLPTLLSELESAIPSDLLQQIQSGTVDIASVVSKIETALPTDFIQVAAAEYAAIPSAINDLVNAIPTSAYSELYSAASDLPALLAEVATATDIPFLDALPTGVQSIVHEVASEINSLPSSEINNIVSEIEQGSFPTELANLPIVSEAESLIGEVESALGGSYGYGSAYNASYGSANATSMGYGSVGSMTSIVGSLSTTAMPSSAAGSPYPGTTEGSSTTTAAPSAFTGSSVGLEITKVWLACLVGLLGLAALL